MSAPRRPVNGRRALRERIQSTWTVYEPAGSPGPFRQHRMAEAAEDFEAVPSPPGAAGSPSSQREPSACSDDGTTPNEAA